MPVWDISSAIVSLRSLLGDNPTDKFEFKSDVRPYLDPSRSRTRRPRTAMWRTAISGIPEISCSVPISCFPNTVLSSRTVPPRSRNWWRESTTDLGFVLLDSAAFGQAMSISVDYAIMEKTAPCGSAAGVVRLVGCRIVASGLETRAQGCRRQCGAGQGHVP